MDPIDVYRIVTHAVHDARKQLVFRRHKLDREAVPIKKLHVPPDAVVDAWLGRLVERLPLQVKTTVVLVGAIV